ncbi:trigger factor-like [Daphnia pulex]|uniref:trigger factor-like n=1 Tax=Daphnia pulex TaxID=6669 RepID=UPI001EE0A17D|nr:trigger factor-like [Daphnia pulex]
MELFPNDQKQKRLENVEFLLDVTELRPDVFEALMGKKAGDVVETQIVFSKDVPDQKIAGKIVETRFSIDEILERAPFEVSEEFDQFMKFETLEKLKENARKNLESQRESLGFLWIKRKILDFFAQKYVFEVPQKLVDIEYHSIWKQTYEELGIPEIAPEDPKEKAAIEELFKEHVANAWRKNTGVKPPKSRELLTIKHKLRPMTKKSKDKRTTKHHE